MTSVVISSPGLTPLELDDPVAGRVVTAVDAGAPQPRVVANAVPQGHGTVDDSRWLGSRAVVIKMSLVEEPHTLRGLLDQLAPFLDLARRSVLTVDDGTATRSLTVRSDGEIPVAWSSAGYLDMPVGWVTVGSPFWTGDVHQVAVTPSDEVAAGWVPPLIPPLTFPPHIVVSGAAINRGTAPADWVARIYGPVTSPTLINRATGARISLPGLTVALGDFVELDSAARTVTINGLADSSRYGYLDFISSTWWPLTPGAQALAVEAAAWESPAVATVEWHDTYLI